MKVAGSLLSPPLLLKHPDPNAGMRYDMWFCAKRECSGNCMHEIKAHAKLHRAISIYLLFTW